MLTKKEKKASCIAVYGATMLLNSTDALDDIGKMELFSRGKKGNFFLGEQLVEVHGYFFGQSRWFSVVLGEVCVGGV